MQARMGPRPSYGAYLTDVEVFALDLKVASPCALSAEVSDHPDLNAMWPTLRLLERGQ